MNAPTRSAPAEGREAWPATPASVGLEFRRTDRYRSADIAAFARACGDTNPLHDERAAQFSFREVIASGQHTSAMLLSLATSYFSRPRESVRPTEVLVLHVNFAFKHPVFAEEEAELRWRVDEVSWNQRQAGHVLVLSGDVHTARFAPQPALVARTALLVRAAP
ncbi:MAG TPA: MaoC/PaaZ C-terminal domain-containing protein [Methylibium sp.]|uniref:MaoC/PaaZ C-terminal domain-containing protein n=1 Tax=Methylibium sp. TaxID=2067992 RepID=UPI002DB75026|nr:MaoC/PaaZ C-terminal domain-containing protein [Methylibium sp.]HEU4460815.1 MaoC/PaaZ C-terminal domain-containing protein [Methylibium sp.]